MEDILKSIDFLSDFFNAEADNTDLFDLFELSSDYSGDAIVFYTKNNISLSLKLATPEEGYINTDKEVVVSRDFYLYDSNTKTPLSFYNGKSINNGIFRLESKVSVLPYLIGGFKEIKDEIDKLSAYTIK